MKPNPAALPLKPPQTRPERRRANRQYQKVIDANRRYFDAKSAVEVPLLEHIHTSRHRASADSRTTADVVAEQVAEDQRDTVFSRCMADVIASDGKRPYRQRNTQADRIRSCGAWQGVNICPDGHRKPARTYCDEPKYCRRCARIKAYRQADELFLQTSVLLHHQITGFDTKLVTMTVIPTGDVLADLQTLMDAWRKVWRSVLQRPHAAAIRYIEVGSENNMIHCHVLYYGPWIDRDELLAKWEAETGSRTVHVKAIRGGDELKKACYEVSKYVLDYDKWIGRYGMADGLQKIYAIGRQLFGRRLVERYGAYRSQVWQSLHDEPMPKADEPVPERCDCCGKLWLLFMPVSTPRGPPSMLIRAQSHG